MKYVQLTSRYCIYFVFKTDFLIAESNVAVSVSLKLNYHNLMNFQQIFLSVLSQVSDPIITHDIHSGVWKNIALCVRVCVCVSVLRKVFCLPVGEIER